MSNNSLNSSSNQLSNSHNQLSQRLQAAVSQPLMQAPEQTVINRENESKIARPPHLPVQPQPTTAQVPRSTSPSKSAASRTKSPGSGKSNGLPAHGWSLSPDKGSCHTPTSQIGTDDGSALGLDSPLSGENQSSSKNGAKSDEDSAAKKQRQFEAYVMTGDRSGH